jgi:hypothetical protein
MSSFYPPLQLPFLGKSAVYDSVVLPAPVPHRYARNIEMRRIAKRIRGSNT